MSFQVLAIAPIGTGEKSAVHLLRFLSQVFYLKEPPSLERFKTGGVCFLQALTLREAKTTALRLQMLGADFRIIDPRGHVVSEGHGRRRSQMTGPHLTRDAAKSSSTSVARPAPVQSNRRPTGPLPPAAEAPQDCDTVIESVELQLDDPHRKKTREVQALPGDLDDSAAGQEVENDNPRWPPPGIEEVGSESMFERETIDLEGKIQELRELEAIHQAEDADDDELYWDFNEGEEDSLEVASSDDKPLPEKQHESELVVEAGEEHDDPAPVLDITHEADPHEFDKQTSNIKQVDVFAEGELVMLDGSAPKQKPPSEEVDFLPPATGLEEPVELDDFDDHCPRECSIPSIDLCLDDLDDG